MRQRAGLRGNPRHGNLRRVVPRRRALRPGPACSRRGGPADLRPPGTPAQLRCRRPTTREIGPQRSSSCSLHPLSAGTPRRASTFCGSFCPARWIVTPSLKLLSGHWGEFVAGWLDRLDETIGWAKHLDRPVSEYYREHVWITPSGMYSQNQLQFFSPNSAPSGSSTPRTSPTSSATTCRTSSSRRTSPTTSATAIAHRNAEKRDADQSNLTRITVLMLRRCSASMPVPNRPPTRVSNLGLETPARQRYSKCRSPERTKPDLLDASESAVAFVAVVGVVGVNCCRRWRLVIRVPHRRCLSSS